MQLNGGVEGGQRDRHVRGLGGDAVRGVAQYGEVAVGAVAGRAAGARGALVAGLGDVLEVGAAGALEQVAAGGRGVAQLPRGAGQQRLGQDGVAVAYGGGAARSLLRTIAPIRSPPSGSSSIRSSGSRVTSMSSPGAPRPSFIRSTRLVPPPRKRAPGCPAPARTASSTLAARRYPKGFTTPLLATGGSRRPGRWPHRRTGHPDGVDDPGIGAAAAQIAAHPLPDLVRR